MGERLARVGVRERGEVLFLRRGERVGTCKRMLISLCFFWIRP